MKINITLPKPHAGQQTVLASKARFKVLMCGRRWGKTLICQSEAIQRMLKKQHVAYITPEYGLASDFYDEIVDMLPEAVIKKKDKSRLLLKLITGGTLKFYSGEALPRMRGKHFHCVIVDEAAHIPELAKYWSSVVRMTLTDKIGHGIFISTPNGRDFFNSLYELGLNGTDEDFASFHYTTYDNPHISHKEIEKIKAETAEAVFNQENLAIPLSDKDNPFGSAEIIDGNVVDSLSSKEAVCYAIDLATYNDYTVVTGMDEDGNLCYFDRFQLSYPLTIERLQELPDYTTKVIDGTGVGVAVYQQMQTVMSNVESFTFTGQSKPAIIFELIKDVQMGSITYNDIIANEMKSLAYKRSVSTGHLSFAAKSGYFDDGVMSVAMCNHYRKFVNASDNWEIYTV